MYTIKLQKFLAHAQIASRRKAEELIEQGKVLVNGMPAHLGQRINQEKDTIEYNGEIIASPDTEPVYILLDKPAGIVSTTSDEMGRKTVLSLLDPEITSQYRLYPVGRLDIENKGLILLTNDGALTHKLTHPKFGFRKTYHVRIAGTPTTPALNHLRRGVKLGKEYTRPAEVAVLGHDDNQTWLEITISEGKNRQVRRMLERVGYNTVELIRVQLGPFHLDDLGGKRSIFVEKPDLEKLG